MAKIRNSEKSKRDLKIAEIIYYSIGGLALFVGTVFSILGLILANPTKENIEKSFLKVAEKDFFNWFNLDTTFANAGTFLMVISILYFVLVFFVFTRKGDQIEKITSSKKSRQRQVVFTANAESTNVVEAEVHEKE